MNFDNLMHYNLKTFIGLSRLFWSCSFDTDRMQNNA